MRKRIIQFLLILGLLLPLATDAVARTSQPTGGQAFEVRTVIDRVVNEVKRLFPRRVGSAGDHLGPPWPAEPIQPAPRGK